jgi:hypothetical protein
VLKHINPYGFQIKNLKRIKLEYKVQVSTEKHPVDLTDCYQDMKTKVVFVPKNLF